MGGETSWEGSRLGKSRCPAKRRQVLPLLTQVGQNGNPPSLVWRGRGDNFEEYDSSVGQLGDTSAISRFGGCVVCVGGVGGGLL